MELSEIIIEKIKNKGPIPFRDFMEMALYEEGLGYFTSGEHIIGKKGDFFTSPYISPAFGAMVAKQILEFREQIEDNFTIVEYGAGGGLLCHDILLYLKSRGISNLRYVIIERSPYLRKLSQKYLPRDIVYLDNIEMLGSFRGCVISNELLDNFPVHRIIVNEDQMTEVYVDYRDGFKEILRPVSEDLRQYLDPEIFNLPDGCCAEICQDAAFWFQEISRFMEKGYILTIDYGYHADELLQSPRSGGTLRCYYKHRMHADPYIHIGKQDITADVNFSLISCMGFRNGFEFAGYVNQSRFLRALGFLPFLSDLKDSEENKLFVFDTLLHQMGSQFKVLLQRKGLPCRPLRGWNLEQPLEKKSVALAADHHYMSH
jgi:SAM-dependent MidA family methyltransferase